MTLKQFKVNLWLKKKTQTSNLFGYNTLMGRDIKFKLIEKLCFK